MHGITTIKKLNDAAVEGRGIMKAAGYDLPVIGATPEAQAAATHTYTPLPEPAVA